jgi:hypothetical protein
MKNLAYFVGSRYEARVSSHSQKRVLSLTVTHSAEQLIVIGLALLVVD